MPALLSELASGIQCQTQHVACMWTQIRRWMPQLHPSLKLVSIFAAQQGLHQEGTRGKYQRPKVAQDRPSHGCLVACQLRQGSL